jgi:plastocyanin
MEINQVLANFQKRAKVTDREDLLCMRCNSVGTANKGYIYNVHYAFVEQLPTRVQIQAALNRDFGSNVVMDPTSVMGGTQSITAKVFSKTKLGEFDEPKTYVANLGQAYTERPNSCYVEIGDQVRFYDAAVTEGQVVGYDSDKFSIRVGSAIQSVAGDRIIDVKKALKFDPVDESARAYYLEIFPPEFVKMLTNNDPKKVENSPSKVENGQGKK